MHLQVGQAAVLRDHDGLDLASHARLFSREEKRLEYRRSEEKGLACEAVTSPENGSIWKGIMMPISSFPDMYFDEVNVTKLTYCRLDR